MPTTSDVVNQHGGTAAIGTSTSRRAELLAARIEEGTAGEAVTKLSLVSTIK